MFDIIYKTIMNFIKVGCEVLYSFSSMKWGNRSKELEVKLWLVKNRDIFVNFERGISVSEFCKWQQFKSVILLIIAGYMNVKVQSLVNTFSPTVGLKIKCYRFLKINF